MLKTVRVFQRKSVWARPDFNSVLDEVWKDFLFKYQPQKCYIDGSNPAVVADLCIRYGDESNYLEAIKRYESQHINWENNFHVIPRNWNQIGRGLLSHLKMIVDNNMLQVHPSFKEVHIALRSAFEKGEFKLDKERSENNDILDGLMLCLSEYTYEDR